MNQNPRLRKCSECDDWFSNPLNPNPVNAENPHCPIHPDDVCARFPDAPPQQHSPALRSLDPYYLTDELMIHANCHGTPHQCEWDEALRAVRARMVRLDGNPNDRYRQEQSNAVERLASDIEKLERAPFHATYGWNDALRAAAALVRERLG